MASSKANQKLNEVIQHKTIYLKLLTPQDVSEKYANWMKDPQIIQHMADKDRNDKVTELKKYVRSLFESLQNYLFGIYICDINEHIGNIKIGNIEPKHLYADIGLLIGEKQYWGKGFGTLAITAATDFAFSNLLLNKLVATMASPNKASIKAFLNAGYQHVGTLHKHRLFEGNFIDVLIVEKLKKIKL